MLCYGYFFIFIVRVIDWLGLGGEKGYILFLKIYYYDKYRGEV